MWCLRQLAVLLCVVWLLATGCHSAAGLPCATPSTGEETGARTVEPVMSEDEP